MNARLEIVIIVLTCLTPSESHMYLQTWLLYFAILLSQ